MISAHADNKAKHYTNPLSKRARSPGKAKRTIVDQRD
jgi:hypothetical protein